MAKKKSAKFQHTYCASLTPCSSLPFSVSEAARGSKQENNPDMARNAIRNSDIVAESGLEPQHFSHASPGESPRCRAPLCSDVK